MTGISDEIYEQLRQILEKQNEHTYSLGQTEEIGDGLTDFYNLLLAIERENDNQDICFD